MSLKGIIATLRSNVDKLKSIYMSMILGKGEILVVPVERL